MRSKRHPPNTWTSLWSLVWPTGVKLLDFCCCWLCCWVSPYWILIYMFAVLMDWWVRSPSRQPNNFYVWTSAEPRAKVVATWNRFKSTPPPSHPTQVIYYWPFQGDASVVVYSNCLVVSVGTGSMIGTPEQLKWESLKKRRRDSRLILLHEGLKDKATIPTDNLTLLVRRCRNHHDFGISCPHCQ